MLTADRFAKGRTFREYLEYTGSAENMAREAFGGRYLPDSGSVGGPRRDNSAIFRERYEKARLADHQAAAIKWLAAQPGGPAKLLVISEDWSSDCRRDVPMLARLAEAGGLEMRVFNRDGKKILGTRRPDPAAYPDSNHDLMLQLLKKDERGEWAAVPVAVVYSKDFTELHRYIEFPEIYEKDRLRAEHGAVRPGESEEQARDRAQREFLALQRSPFFDLWASAAVDEIISGIHRTLHTAGAARG